MIHPSERWLCSSCCQREKERGRETEREMLVTMQSRLLEVIALNWSTRPTRAPSGQLVTAVAATPLVPHCRFDRINGQMTHRVTRRGDTNSKLSISLSVLSVPLTDWVNPAENGWPARSDFRQGDKDLGYVTPKQTRFCSGRWVTQQPVNNWVFCPYRT